MNKILFTFIFIIQLSFAQNSIDSIQKLNDILIIYQADKLTPVTYQNITLEEIQANSVGQEPSFLFSKTPSIIAHADGGHTQGYSYFTLRGIDQTRINITFDGVPLNDPADHAFYFSNYTDILQSVDKIQIQRGIGTSKNGTASYAGSIEIFSKKLNKPKEINFGIGYGSYNSFRAYSSYNSGVKNKKGIYVRLSKIYSDGFKQHSSNNAQSLFLSSGLFLDKSIWKINLLAGNQKNELSWMAVSEEEINCDRTTNSNSEFEKDDFSQMLLQIQNSFNPNKKHNIQSSIYYTLADGWWDFDLPNYLGQLATESDIFNYQVKSNLLGLYSNYTYKHNGFQATTGFHTNTYINKFTESQKLSGNIWNKNTKYKDEISAFQKIQYNINDVLFFGDLQFRKSWFDYNGNMNFRTISWSFINPKFGISYSGLSKMIDERNITLYFNIGRSSREPSRYDMFEGNDILLYLCPTDENGNYLMPEYGNSLISSVKPEHVVNYELGIRHQVNNFNLNINFYHLSFNNERVLNGAYGPNGLALTSNVDKSTRSGIELHSFYKLNNNIELINNSSFNNSIIKENNITFTPILTPSIIINQEIVYSFKKIAFSLSTRYQSKSYMNFENSEYLNDYILINGRVDYFIKNHSISLFINNITDNYYFNNGIVDWDGLNKYFVQSPRNIYLSVKLKF
ncbi:MAG: TonB-dependent receptor [Flavobacteriales bacterium]|nr:TonB-dependent receptor [Flavobacteriales bacterium]|tara:strand:- start:1065 stop:3107 length:2043 start_codon:yes stop_codon:yes gene_type:complete